MGTADATRDGIRARKAFDAGRFEVPVILFRIESTRGEPTGVTVTDRVPSEVPTERIRFHPEFDGEHWRVTTDRAVEYEGTIPPGGEVITLYAADVPAETARATLMGPPTITAVNPRGSADGRAAADVTDATADGTASAGERRGRNGADRQRGRSRRNAAARDTTEGQTGGQPGTATRPQENGRDGRYGQTQPLSVLGGVVGAATFLLGYLLTYLLEAGSLDEAMSSSDLLFVQNPSAEGGIDPTYLENDLGIDPPETYQLVGWLYHDLHTVDLTGTFGVSGGSDAVEYDVAMQYGPDAFIYALPPMALVAGGFLLVRYLGLRRGESAAKAGASVAIGYGPMAIASAFVLTWEASSTLESGDQAVTYAVEFGPEVGAGLAVFGIVFPVVFGALGGYLAAETTP